MRWWWLALGCGCTLFGSGSGNRGPDAASADSPPAPTLLVRMDPTQLAGSTLAIDAASLYFTTTTGVMKVPLAGGTPTLVATGITGPLAQDATNLYGFGSAGVVSAPKASGATTTIVPGSNYRGALAVAAGHLYFHDYYGDRVNGDNYHQSLLQLALGTTTVMNVASNQFITSELYVDSGRAYWISDNCTTVDVMSAPIGGGSATSLANFHDSPADFAFDGTTLFWTVASACNTPPTMTGIVAMPAAGGTPAAVISGVEAPGSLAVDAAQLYFASNFQRVMKVAKTGGTPVAIATASTPMSLVVDDTSVYWVNYGDGTIVKTAK
jgi:hypothetical protein